MRYIFISVLVVKFDFLLVNILNKLNKLKKKKRKEQKEKRNEHEHLQGSQWDDE